MNNKTIKKLKNKEIVQKKLKNKNKCEVSA
jgi:hypothetical protein